MKVGDLVQGKVLTDLHGITMCIACSTSKDALLAHLIGMFNSEETIELISPFFLKE